MKWIFLFIAIIIEILFICINTSVFFYVSLIYISIVSLSLILYLLFKFKIIKMIIFIISIIILLMFNFFIYYNKTNDFVYVLHAGGGYDGCTYLNAVQNFEYYLSLGVEYFELDFVMTKDDNIIGSHEFEYFEGYNFEHRPTYEEIIDYKICGKYDVITLDYLLNKIQHFHYQ